MKWNSDFAMCTCMQQNKGLDGKDETSNSNASTIATSATSKAESVSR